MILIEIPSQNYPAGKRTFDTPNPLAANVTRIRVTLTRENWPGDPNTPIVDMGFQVALDGVNYPASSGGSGSLPGGVIFQRDGTTPIMASYVDVKIPGVGLTTRKVKATVENFQTLRTSVKVESF